MSIDLLVDPFFERIAKVPDYNSMQKYQVAWVPCPFIDSVTKVLDVERAQAGDHNNVKYELRPVTAKDFNKKGTRLPIHRIQLWESEELTVAKAKKRPCLLIAKNHIPHNATEVESLTGKKLHQLDDIYVFAPMYSIALACGDSGYGAALVNNIKQMKYDHLIYAKNQTKGVNLSDAIIRLDRVFCVRGHYLNIEPEECKLSRDAEPVVAGIIQKYFVGVESEQLTIIKECLNL